MAEAGATPAQEVAFTLANGVAYVEAALAAGLDVDQIGPRLSFFFVARTTVLEEVAKFRAARRIWARLMREHFGARDPRSCMLRFHTQTAGVQLTAQQPEVNLVRVTVQALAAVLGGTQSLHTNAFDEAIALPTPKSARLALRTQQVLAYETDVTETVDPFAGSYVVESLTDDLEAEVSAPDGGGGRAGWGGGRDRGGYQKGEIERSAYAVAQEIDSGERVVVGVNRFAIDAEDLYEPLRLDPAVEAAQIDRVRPSAGRAGRLCSTRGPRPGPRRRRRSGQCPARPEAGVGPSRDPRGGLRRPPRRVGRLPPGRALLMWFARLQDRPFPERPRRRRARRPRSVRRPAPMSRSPRGDRRSARSATATPPA